jgi:hypothetical protein
MPRKTGPARKAVSPTIPEPTTATTHLASLGAAPLAGASHDATGPTLERFSPAGPVPPHTTRLLIVRCPGGFMAFDGDGKLDGQIDADPAEAIALAATPLDLVVKIEAWALASPPPEYPA